MSAEDADAADDLHQMWTAAGHGPTRPSRPPYLATALDDAADQAAALHKELARAALNS